jgi:hypothetical protein
LQRKTSGQTKVAASSGISIFLLEELGDARLRCAQLKKYIDEAVKLIEKSGERDHFFEVAAHLIHGIPDTLLRMDKALTAAAMAAAKMDYEDNKDDIRPEKIEELDRAMEDVRVRRVQRRSEDKQGSAGMKIPEAVARLEHLAASIEATGTVNASELSDLIVSLEGQSVKKASATTEIADVLRTLSASLLDTSDPENKPSRVLLAATLRRVLGDTVDLKTAAFGPLKVRNREHGSGVAADDFTAALNQAAENLYVCRGVNDAAQTAVDDALTGRIARIGPLTGMPNQVIAVAEKVKKSAYALRFAMGDVANDWEHLARLVKKALPEAERYDVKYAAEPLADDTKESRFEEGKPADPTKQMDPDDAKKWKQNTEEHKDDFKTAASSYGGDPRWIHAKYPGKSRDGTAFKKGDLVLYWPSDKSFDVGDKAETAWKRFESEVEDEDVYNNSRMANTLADQLIESRFEEGKPADPTENMDPEDAKKWKTEHDKNKDNFKAASRIVPIEEAKKGDMVESELGVPWPKDSKKEKFTGKVVRVKSDGTVTVDFTKGSSNPDGHSNEDVGDVDIRLPKKTASEDEEKLSRFEEGKPADPTKQMSPEDAKKWKQQTEEHKDEFKTAAGDIEYVIWGIPPGEHHENVLYTKAESMAEAKKVITVLETKHGCTKCRVQVLDLTKAPDFSKIFKAASDPWKVEAASGPSPSGSNWKEIKGFSSHAEMFQGRPVQTWSWDSPTVAFAVQEFAGPGIPLYSLEMVATIGGTEYKLQTRRPPQFKKPQDAFKFAAVWYKMIDAFENGGGVGLDLTTDWKPKA